MKIKYAIDTSQKYLMTSLIKRCIPILYNSVFIKQNISHALGVMNKFDIKQKTKNTRFQYY